MQTRIWTTALMVTEATSRHLRQLFIHIPPSPHTPPPSLNRTVCVSVSVSFFSVTASCCPFLLLTQSLKGKTKHFLLLEIKSHEQAPGLPTAAACCSRVDLFRGSTGSGIPAMVSLGPMPTPSIWATFPEKAPAAFTTMAHSTGWYSRLFGICTWQVACLRC